MTPAVHRHRDGERLEGRAELIDAERRAVEARFGRALAGGIGVELRQRGHRQHFAGVDVHDDPGRADRREVGHRVEQFMLQRLLDPARDRQGQRLAAGRRVATGARRTRAPSRRRRGRRRRCSR